jgi:hypothetical protein
VQVFTSDHALKLEWVPNWVAIIGSGYIGLEFSDVYTALGSEVTFIEVPLLALLVISILALLVISIQLSALVRLLISARVLIGNHCMSPCQSTDINSCVQPVEAC